MHIEQCSVVHLFPAPLSMSLFRLSYKLIRYGLEKNYIRKIEHNILSGTKGSD